MAFNPARPHYKLPIAGKEYDLLGSFGLIEAVETSMQQGIGDVAVSVVNGMPTHKLVKLLTAVLNANGHEMTLEEAGNLVFEKVGLTGDEIEKLRIHIYSFLCITLAPPHQREQRAEEMGKLIGKLTEASLGESTEEPA